MKRTINKEEFLKLYKRHKEYLNEGMFDDEKKLVWDFDINFVFDFNFILNLRCANLRCANLSNADLRYANLSNADLRYANLSNANLSNANLSNANLSNANLSNANLKYANLSNADLKCADLSNANIDFSCLPLWCGSKDMMLDTKLQAQLLGHIINACKDVQFSEEQKQFVRENWSRAKEFLGVDF